MTIQQLRKAHQKKPFEPFTLKLADGTEVRVRHSENLSYSESGRTVIIITPDELWEAVDLLPVTAPHGRGGPLAPALPRRSSARPFRRKP